MLGKEERGGKESLWKQHEMGGQEEGWRDGGIEGEREEYVRGEALFPKKPRM